jgi:hypothetical protein
MDMGEKKNSRNLSAGTVYKAWRVLNYSGRGSMLRSLHAPLHSNSPHIPCDIPSPPNFAVRPTSLHSNQHCCSVNTQFTRRVFVAMLLAPRLIALPCLAVITVEVQASIIGAQLQLSDNLKSTSPTEIMINILKKIDRCFS